jgi:outer membrane protein OmpA-like peptidoglycan-associated protein
LVAHDNGPRFLEQLSDGNAFVYARGTPEDALAQTAINAFKYSQLPPQSEVVDRADDVFNRARTAQSEWPSRIYVLPESLAFQAERNRSRILIESAGVEVLAVSDKFVKNHSADLSDFLKSYFKTLASIDTPNGGIENAIVQNSAATPSDAQRLAAHSRWLNASENYARFGISTDASALPERLKNDLPLKALYASNFHAIVREPIRQFNVEELSESQWRNARKIADLRDSISFSRGSDELTAAKEAELKGIATIINLFPDCYVIIRGNNRNDRELAKKRAELVKIFLNQKCGVDKKRLYAEVPLVSDESAGVSFLLVKPRT